MTITEYIDALRAVPRVVHLAKPSKRRPNQKVVAIKDLSSAERAELADRLARVEMEEREVGP